MVDAREKLRAAKPEDKMAVFAVLMRLREICCDPRLIADNLSLIHIYTEVKLTCAQDSSLETARENR